MKLASQRTVERALIIVTACLLIIPFVRTPLRIEYGLLDFRFSVARGGRDAEDVRQVAVVLADTVSEERLDRLVDTSWREFYPRVLEVLTSAGARAVVWDVAFAGSEPALDPVLADSFRRSVPVIGGEERSSVTTPVLKEALTAVGWIALVGHDSIPRRVPAVHDPPPLSWIAASYLPGGPADGSAGPMEPVWIDYAQNLDLIPAFSMVDLIEADGGRLANELHTPVSVFRDRVVFIGQALPSSDRYAMPGSGGVRIPGVYSQVAATLTFAQPRLITRPARFVDWLIAAFFAAAVTIAWTFNPRVLRTGATVAGVVTGLVLPLVVFVGWRLWISYSAMIVAIGVPLVAGELVRRVRVNKSYRSSLGFDPELIQKHRALIESAATGVERNAVVLCSDVRNYTQFVADHDPDVVQRVMTEYMVAMETVVDSNGGYVNKYVGDEIVAVFGFPRDESDTVNRAVDAALAMLNRLESLRSKWIEEGLPPLEAVGIGLDSGTVRFTQIGGRHRVQFDIIGNPINGASRLQTLSKVHGRPLILPAEMVEVQDRLEVVMYGTREEEIATPSVTFIGEVMIRGQGRRRLYGLADPGRSTQ